MPVYQQHVTRTTDQTITGNKEFDVQQVFDSDASAAAGESGGALQIKGDVTGDVFSIRDTAGAFSMVFTGTPLTANRVVNIPNADGDFLLAGGVQTVGSKAILSTNTLRSLTASSGVSFEDNTTNTKKLRMILSTAVGNNALSFANTAARIYKYQNVAGTVVIVGDEEAAPSTNNLGKVDRTGITAVTAATNLTSATAIVGFYAIHYEMTCTTGTVADGSLSIDTIATGDQGAQTVSGTATLPLSTATTSATNPIRGTIVRYVASGGLQYSTTVTGLYTAATTRTALRVRVTYLG